MIDLIGIREQIQTFQDYLSAIEKFGTIYNENHIISILLNKILPSCSSFDDGLRYKIDSLNFMGVYITIRIEEENQNFL